MAILSGCDNPGRDIHSNNYENGYLNINNAEIFYKIMGSGEPILIIHGGPGLDHSYLLPHMEQLRDEYQLIFYDQRASGKSSYDVDTLTISIDGFMDDIEGIRTSLGFEKIIVLGHSWGGLLAMYYGIRHPENVKAMILVNAMSPDSKFRKKQEALLASRMTEQDSIDQAQILGSEALKKHEAGAYEDLFRLLFRREFFNKELADNLILTFPDDFYARSQILQYLGRDLAEYNIYDDLEYFPFPTLIIYGDYNLLSNEVAHKIDAHIPNSELVILKNCGHFPYIEQKDAFFTVIRSFLK